MEDKVNFEIDRLLDYIDSKSVVGQQGMSMTSMYPASALQITVGSIIANLAMSER